jgi:KaiC/GvpD/RAD55 family RecA-like ATPase
VSRATEGGYAVECAPIEPIAPGTTVLVAGPALSGAERLARSIVADGVDDGEGTLFVSTGMACERLLRACRETHPSIDPTRMGVIDCSGQEIGTAETDMRVKYVSTQNDLTGIGMNFSSLYESLYADAAGGRIRTSLVSLSSLSMYVDLRTLFQFAQTLSGRIGSAGGLGVFAIDPTAHDAKTVNTLNQAADAKIEVRETEDGEDELRVRGLSGQPDGWRAFSAP